MRLIFDIETDGLLDSLTQIHCLVLRDIDNGTVWRYNSQTPYSIKEGLYALQKADLAVGHNAIAFDVPAIKKLYPWFDLDEAKVRDTLVMARLIYPDLGDVDMKLIKKGQLPGQFLKRHSLEAWGYRLGFKKGDYAKEMKAKGLDPWAAWNPEMEDYCAGDTEVTVKLFEKLVSKGCSEQAIELEHQVQWIISRQERYGFKFDTQSATKLYTTLVSRKLELEAELKKVFKSLTLPMGAPFIPKVNNKKLGYVKGVPIQRYQTIEFNPGSRDHIALWLKHLYKWKPTAFTNDGKAKMDEEVLATLPYPEAKLLTEYFLVDKRLGMLAEGKEAWLRHERNGRMYGSVNTMGTITFRASHSKPNLGQVPAVYSPYGKDCRTLFCVPDDKELVGADMSGIELRDLAHYMARYDGGAYATEILKGDIHTANQKAAGLPTRDNAKTFIYAFLYGAGADKLGSIIGKGAKEGQQLKTRFLKQTPALKKLIDAVSKAAEKGYLVGLDGRHIPIRHKHAALNTLLQSCGAIQSKQWLVFFDQEIKRQGLEDKVQQVAWVHDEIQVECDKGLGETVGKIAVESIRKVGDHFNFRCPLDGEFKVGRNWAETH